MPTDKNDATGFEYEDKRFEITQAGTKAALVVDNGITGIDPVTRRPAGMIHVGVLFENNGAFQTTRRSSSV